MSLFIPPRTKESIKSLGLDDWTIEDVFNTGTQRPGTPKRFKKYESKGYTVQITVIHNEKGEDIVTHVSKW